MIWSWARCAMGPLVEWMPFGDSNAIRHGGRGGYDQRNRWDRKSMIMGTMCTKPRICQTFKQFKRRQTRHGYSIFGEIEWTMVESNKVTNIDISQHETQKKFCKGSPYGVIKNVAGTQLPGLIYRHPSSEPVNFFPYWLCPVSWWAELTGRIRARETVKRVSWG